MSKRQTFSKVEMMSFFNSGQTLSYDFRIKSLKTLKQNINKYSNDLSLAAKKDFSKLTFETYMTELMMVKDELNYF